MAGFEFAAMNHCQDIVPWLGGVLLLFSLKAQFGDQLIDAVANGPIRDVKHALHFFDIAAIPDEEFQEPGSFRAWIAEAAWGKASGYLGLTARAGKTRHFDVSAAG